MTTMGPAPAFAYVESDVASKTVTEVVSRLRNDTGDVDRTFGILEDISKIITEGKGVGGTITYGEIVFCLYSTWSSFFGGERGLLFFALF